MEDEMATALTQDLARFIAGLRYEQIPPAALAPIQHAFADTIGVAIAGAHEPAPQLVKAMLAPSGGEATLLGGQGGAGALDAAWINGTAAHALDFDDVSQRGIGHASAFLVPAILAEAQALGASGRHMVEAYAAGYETIAELARRDADVGRYHDKGWHPTGFFGAVGAAAACASLRRLTPAQCAMALGLSASQACGLIANVGTMTKPLHAGRAAHAGVASARLAGSGFTAAADALEHAPGFLHAFSFGGRIDADAPVRAGEEWQICGGNRISVKKYPMCYCTHRAIDGMLDLVRAHPVDTRAVERIAVTISRRNAQILRNHAPRTGLEAKFSIEFAMVSPIIAGRAGLAELTDDFVLRPDVQALMQRVVVVPDDRDNPDRPGYAVHDRVVIDLRDGTRFDSGPITATRGDHDSPLSRDELWIKFDDCIAAGKTGVAAAPLFEALTALGAIGHVRELAALLA
jgi:2-methylcitrate dehydratase PrpD